MSASAVSAVLSCLPRFRRGISPPSRSPPPLRRKTSSTVRALAMAPREAAVARMPALAHREVALWIAGEMEARLGAWLLPSAVPASVAEFRNSSRNAVGSLDVRRGAPGSSIDFTMECWLHCKVPNGAIDITSVIAGLNGSTDAPHFVMEFIQGSPTSLVVLLDLLPRKDLPLHLDYVDKYYLSTQLEKPRQDIERLPQARPFRSPSLFVRSVWSPTAIVATIDCGPGGESVLEEVVRAQVGTAAREVLQIWLDHCADSTAEMEEAERESMIRRDRIIRAADVEVSANLPRMFGPDVSNRVLAEIRKAFGLEKAA